MKKNNRIKALSTQLVILIVGMILFTQSCADFFNTPDSLYRRGKALYDKKQFPEAFMLFQQAADAGHAEAENQVGWMYARGEGVTTDYAKALIWYHKAVRAGSAASMNNSGWMYHKGEGVKQDDQLAVQWYRRAVSAGSTKA